jgi:hypothetical protein
MSSHVEQDDWHCYQCGAELTNPTRRKHAGVFWCIPHFESAVQSEDPLAVTRTGAAPRAESPATESTVDLPIAAFLRLLAWLQIIGGVIGSIWLWSAVASVPRYSTFSPDVPLGSEFSPMGAVIAGAVLVQGLVTGALLLAASIGVNDLRATRNCVQALSRSAS